MKILALLLAAASLPAADLAPYVPRLERALRENLVPFWMSRAIDKEMGGYHINFNAGGEPNGRTSKGIVTQARTVWLFARLAREHHLSPGPSKAELLAAADHGYRFLVEKMHDPVHRGYFWEVDRAGKPLRADKHLYGQSFALYALSEFALASGRKDVLRQATELFHMLEAKAHDKEFGGYIETFSADWKPLDRPGPMGDPAFKLMNTHLHLMEAMTTFYEASKLPLARERLIELITIESNTVVRKSVGACTDKYSRDWMPRLDGAFARVSYGHDIENVWLLMEASRAAGISGGPLRDLYRTLFDYSLRYGYDEVGGGFYDSGEFHKPADRRDKIWWVQAEAIVSALKMYRLTGEEKYAKVFTGTWELIESKMIDWKAGEWHSTVTISGEQRGDKAQIWKAGYHNGRALIECLLMLRPSQK
jgi:mannobiose 2-epimerase